MTKSKTEMWVKGPGEWNSLIGKSVEFVWCDGWENWRERGTVETVQVYATDPRYPKVSVGLSEGGATFWADEGVFVSVSDSAGNDNG